MAHNAHFAKQLSLTNTILSSMCSLAVDLSLFPKSSFDSACPPAHRFPLPRLAVHRSRAVSAKMPPRACFPLRLNSLPCNLSTNCAPLSASQTATSDSGAMGHQLCMPTTRVHFLRLNTSFPFSLCKRCRPVALLQRSPGSYGALLKFPLIPTSMCFVLIHYKIFYKNKNYPYIKMNSELQ